MRRLAVLVVALTGLAVTNAIVTSDKLDEVFTWKVVPFQWPSEEIKNAAIQSGDYIEENNMPLGFARWQDKMFVTVPRWKAGVAATLNYIPLNTTESSPALIPYPDFESNQLPKGDQKPGENNTVSIFRLNVDACDRLWALDTGLADILGEGKQVSPPSLLIWDLKTDKLIHRYPLKPEDMTEHSFFANVIVDVTADKCDQAFAYIPDLGGYGVVVYSLANDASWRIRHNYFHFDPLKGDLTVGGINFQWTDGIFGIALGPIANDGYRTAYFHPLASECEFSVNTKVWRNKTLALNHESYFSYKFEGLKGDKSQASSSVLDEPSSVLFFTQLQKDGIACWNTKKELKPENVEMVVQDHEKIIFANDIKIDHERNLWILSDKLPHFVRGLLDSNQTNYRIMKVPVEEALKNTVCL